jgi:hypothetical protein
VTAGEIEHAPLLLEEIGAPVVFPEMFALARTLLDWSLVVDVSQVEEALSQGT